MTNVYISPNCVEPMLKFIAFKEGVCMHAGVCSIYNAWIHTNRQYKWSSIVWNAIDKYVVTTPLADDDDYDVMWIYIYEKCVIIIMIIIWYKIFYVFLSSLSLSIQMEIFVVWTELSCFST